MSDGYLSSETCYRGSVSSFANNIELATIKEKERENQELQPNLEPNIKEIPLLGKVKKTKIGLVSIIHYYFTVLLKLICLFIIKKHNFLKNELGLQRFGIFRTSIHSTNPNFIIIIIIIIISVSLPSNWWYSPIGVVT